LFPDDLALESSRRGHPAGHRKETSRRRKPRISFPLTAEDRAVPDRQGNAKGGRESPADACSRLARASAVGRRVPARWAYQDHGTRGPPLGASAGRRVPSATGMHQDHGTRGPLPSVQAQNPLDTLSRGLGARDSRVGTGVPNGNGSPTGAGTPRPLSSSRANVPGATLSRPLGACATVRDTLSYPDLRARLWTRRPSSCIPEFGRMANQGPALWARRVGSWSPVTWIDVFQLAAGGWRSAGPSTWTRPLCQPEPDRERRPGAPRGPQVANRWATVSYVVSDRASSVASARTLYYRNVPSGRRRPRRNGWSGSAGSADRRREVLSGWVSLV
jgi:hypothetical protein